MLIRVLSQLSASSQRSYVPASILLALMCARERSPRARMLIDFSSMFFVSAHPIGERLEATYFSFSFLPRRSPWASSLRPFISLLLLWPALFASCAGPSLFARSGPPLFARSRQPLFARSGHPSGAEAFRANLLEVKRSRNSCCVPGLRPGGLH